MASNLTELLAELEALGLLQLATEVVGAHPMGLVDDHEIPLGLGELGQQHLVARDLIHPRDQKRMLLERRRPEHRLAELWREDLEREPELQIQLVLPLVDQTTRRDHQAALDVLS